MEDSDAQRFPQSLPELLSLVSEGKKPPAGNLAADNAERADEGHPVGIEFSLVGSFAHQVLDPVMSEKETPYFLLDQFGFPGTEDRAWPALVRLELIEHKLRAGRLSSRGRDEAGTSSSPSPLNPR